MLLEITNQTQRTFCALFACRVLNANCRLVKAYNNPARYLDLSLNFDNYDNVKDYNSVDNATQYSRNTMGITVVL